MTLTISTRINFFVGLLVFLPTAFMGWFFVDHESTALRNEFALRAGNLAENLAQNSDCQLAMMAGDIDGIKRLLNETTNEKNVAYAVVMDKKGDVLTYAGKWNEGKSEIREFSVPVKTETGNPEDVNLGAAKKDEVLGKIIIGLSLAEVNQRTTRLTQILILVMGVVILFSIAGALVGIKYLINRPLKDLITSIEIIGFGDLSHRAEVSSNDELGKLAESFNVMTENLSKLLVSKNYVNNILESMNDILLVFSPEGIIKTVNPSTLNLLGYRESELLGLSYENVIPGETILFDRLKLPDVLKRNVIYSNEDRIFLRKDGSGFPVSFSATLMYDNSGNLQGIICVAQDISRKKSAEEEKQELEKRLQLGEKMEALGRLAGGVAHDLNNTLGAIVGYPDLLLRKLGPDTPHIKAISAIKQSGLKAAAIVRDLLTLARRGISTNKTVNLNHLVEEFVNSPEYEKLTATHPQLTFSVSLSEDLLYLLGSPLHLSKAVSNLVVNAAEAISDEGQVTISTTNRYIDRAVNGDELGLKVGEYVVLEVTDTGIGISAEDQKRIFEPFFTKKEMGRSGTGLGMAVVWGTVKDHNGYIGVDSELNNGTVFHLFFPATRDAVPEKKEEVELAQFKGNGEVILVVDDVEEQREISSGILSHLGYSVFTASSGEAAVDFLSRNHVDLLVLDMIMEPGIDGLETFQLVTELFPGTRAVIASGFAETDRVKKAQQLGAGRFIQKPFTLEKIGIAVKNELSKPSKA